MIGRPGAPAVEEFVGYTGEGLVLEATALGLATCWVSGFFRPEAARRRLGLSPGERVYAVSPLGYAASSYSVKDKVFRRVAGSDKRKPLAEVAAGGPLEDWQRKALEAARLAPSATNRQPWRFDVSTGSITVRVDRGRDDGRFSKRLDCGIAMLHLELGARAAGVDGRWVSLPAPAVARFERNELKFSGSGV
jgi:nitroreductase